MYHQTSLLNRNGLKRMYPSLGILWMANAASDLISATLSAGPTSETNTKIPRKCLDVIGHPILVHNDGMDAASATLSTGQKY